MGHHVCTESIVIRGFDKSNYGSVTMVMLMIYIQSFAAFITVYCQAKTPKNSLIGWLGVHIAMHGARKPGLFAENRRGEPFLSSRARN